MRIDPISTANHEDRDRHQQEAQSDLAHQRTTAAPEEPGAVAMSACQRNHQRDQDHAVGERQHQHERQRQLASTGSGCDAECSEDSGNQKLSRQARAQQHLEDARALADASSCNWLQRCQFERRTPLNFRACVVSQGFQSTAGRGPCKNDRVVESESTRGNRNVPNTQRTGPHRRGRTKHEARTDRTCAHMGFHGRLRWRR